MKAGLVALLVASVAWGQDPADAPKAEARPAAIIKAGEPAYFDGVIMDDAQAVLIGKRIAGCEASLAKAEEKTMISTPILLAGLGAVVAVIAASATAAYFVGRKDGAAP